MARAAASEPARNATLQSRDGVELPLQGRFRKDFVLLARSMSRRICDVLEAARIAEVLAPGRNRDVGSVEAFGRLVRDPADHPQVLVLELLRIEPLAVEPVLGVEPKRLEARTAAGVQLNEAEVIVVDRD